MLAALVGVGGFLLIFAGDLQRASDGALAARLAVVAQDVHATVEARAQLGLKLRYMSDLQPMIERERAANPGLAAITIRSETGSVLYSTDRVTVGEADAQPATGTRIAGQTVAVGVALRNSFAEPLGEVEVSAPRAGLGSLHWHPLGRLLTIAALFLLLAAALAWLGSALLLDAVQRAVRAAIADARRALVLIHGPEATPPASQGGLVTATAHLLGLVQAAAEDIARLDEAGP